MKSVQLSLKLAEEAAVQRLLNAFLREMGIDEPRVQAHSGTSPITCEQGFPFRLCLEKTQKVIFGQLSYWSPSGHHTYSYEFWLANEDCYKKINNDQFIIYLLDEISCLEIDNNLRDNKREQLFCNMLDSINKTKIYIQKFSDFVLNQDIKLDFLYSEQSLYFGHPFHPTPKSSQGFTDMDLQHYAPELQAQFILHFWAISPEIMREEWVSSNIDEREQVIPQEVKSIAKKRLEPAQQQYYLLPCHPWQAQHLGKWKLVQNLQKSGLLVDLGLIGDRVFPTSSVRTVWQPGHPYFYKLPLSVRITNFIRVNSLEQLQRAIDAAKVIAHLPKEVNSSEFQILIECGFRTVSLSNVSQSENEKLIASFAVLFRESPKELQTSSDSLFVVASLLETFPGCHEPKLFQAMRQTNQGKLPNLIEWLRQYLLISLKPMLYLFAANGISLEAHVQNSLVSLKNGLPSKFYVRDLEGISIDRNCALKQGWLNQIISETSPVLYSEQEAWFRLQYYFFVNHLGHLVYTLAKYSEQEEFLYWKVVRDFLQVEQAKASCLDKIKILLQFLLENKTLPAKANLISRFQGCSETPLYINIPNPIYYCLLKK